VKSVVKSLCLLGVSLSALGGSAVNNAQKN